MSFISNFSILALDFIIHPLSDSLSGMAADISLTGHINAGGNIRTKRTIITGDKSASCKLYPPPPPDFEDNGGKGKDGEYTLEASDHDEVDSNEPNVEQSHSDDMYCVDTSHSKTSSKSSDFKKNIGSSIPLHKIALLFFFVLTIGCLIANVALAFYHDSTFTDAQQNAMGLLDWGYKTGIGAIIGVLTGKAAGQE